MGQLEQPSFHQIQQVLRQQQHQHYSTLPPHQFSTTIPIPEELTSREEEGVKRLLSSALLTHHGSPLPPKSEGIVWVLYENCNGLPHTIGRNHTLLQLMDIISKLGADVIGLTETRINFRHRQVQLGITDLFRRESPAFGKASHNTTEEAGLGQEGGTATVAYNELATYVNQVTSGVDPTGLGHWSFLSMETAGGHVTKVVTAYNPCRSNATATRSVYQQHRHYYLQSRQSTLCPRHHFRQDLIAQLKIWRSKGDRILLLMDANDHAYAGSLAQHLTDPEGLNFWEVVQEVTGVPVSATYFWGSKPIDGVWASSDLDTVNACVYPVGFGVGDHRMFGVDISAQSFLGAALTIKRPTARRLTTTTPGVVEQYNDRLTSHLHHHRCLDRLATIHAYPSPVPSSFCEQQLTLLDNKIADYMVNAEQHCRQLFSGQIPYCPELALWLQRKQIYLRILHFHQGKQINRGNLHHSARRCGISSPDQMTAVEIKERLLVCQDRIAYFRISGYQHRLVHLRQRALVARSDGNEEAETRILNIICTESSRWKFRCLRWVLHGLQGQSVSTVQISTDDGPITIEGEQEVYHAILTEIHGKRYTMASSAPICTGQLFDDFGYDATGQATEDLFNGTYPTAQIDPATSAYLHALQSIRQEIPENSVCTWITREDWSRYWNRARERTSSSFQACILDIIRLHLVPFIYHTYMQPSVMSPSNKVFIQSDGPLVLR